VLPARAVLGIFRDYAPDDGARPASPQMQVLSCAIASTRTTSPTLFASPQRPEREVRWLSAGVDALLAQFEMRIVAAEETLAVVEAIRDVEKIATCVAQRS